MKKGLLTLAILEVCRKMALVVEVEHRSTFTFSFQFLKPCTLHRCTLGRNKQKKFLFPTFSHSFLTLLVGSILQVFFMLFSPSGVLFDRPCFSLNLKKKYVSYTCSNIVRSKWWNLGQVVWVVLSSTAHFFLNLAQCALCGKQATGQRMVYKKIDDGFPILHHNY